MNDIERLIAIEDIKRAKARYFRGIDTGNPELVRTILAEACVLDFRGCWIDPETGRDYFPTINIVMRGAASWCPEGFSGLGVVSNHRSVHQGFNCDVEFTSDTTADVVWAMHDRLFWPAGEEYSLINGYGYYYETYVRENGNWKINTLRVSRLRTEIVRI